MSGGGGGGHASSGWSFGKIVGTIAAVLVLGWLTIVVLIPYMTREAACDTACKEQRAEANAKAAEAEAAAQERIASANARAAAARERTTSPVEPNVYGTTRRETGNPHAVPHRDQRGRNQRLESRTMQCAPCDDPAERQDPRTCRCFGSRTYWVPLND